EDMRQTSKEDSKGRSAVVSGSGNVAQYTVEKLNSMGTKPVTLSDSTVFIYDEGGITRERLAFVMELKNVRRGRISEYADKFKGTVFTPVDPKLDHNPLWNIKAQCAFPSATQNEISDKDADNLLKNGVYVVSEGANMPTTMKGVHRFLQAGILYGPGKAANAGGVATSGLEMAQSRMRISWTREDDVPRLPNLNHRWRGHRATVRLHSHVALLNSSTRVLRLLSRDITGKPGCGSLLVFRPPLGGAGVARHRYGLQAGGMHRSGGHID